METFDLIIVLLGVALIIIGLVLFIAGKQDSEKNNQVEGFGIKLNVSNPSIILIVLGIGLVVFPRLMPSSTPGSAHTNQVPTSEITTGSNTQSTQEPPLPTQNLEQQQSAPSQVKPSQVRPSQVRPSESTSSENKSQAMPQIRPQVFFPRGQWYLTQYEENGMDGSGAVQGSIQFNEPSNTRQSWSANIMSFDIWGNQTNYRYVGVIESVGAGYTIDIQSTNEPGFVPPGPTNLIMKMDDQFTLHMEYTIYGSALTLHFSQ